MTDHEFRPVRGRRPKDPRQQLCADCGEPQADLAHHPGAREARQARELLGASQGELAEWLGVDRVTIWRWERGERESPVAQALFALVLDSPARALKVLKRRAAGEQ